MRPARTKEHRGSGRQKMGRQVRSQDVTSSSYLLLGAMESHRRAYLNEKSGKLYNEFLKGRPGCCVVIKRAQQRPRAE